MGVMDFYKNKTILVTGHTGFKGSWLCFLLLLAGADIIGYALPPAGEESLFNLARLKEHIHSVEGDIRDFAHLKQVFEDCRPELVFHLAAQPIVRTGYECPVYTYETNVMGTVNLLECIRTTPGVRSVLNVTTDKVYENKEWIWGYRETDPLDGYDPYSNSKSCSELVTHSYRKSFFDAKGIAISTARAGNVIGGGDFARDRIIPDCIRAAVEGREIKVRNPYSIRPFQHVLEPLWAYLMIVEQQAWNPKKQGCYNVGPEDSDCVAVGKLADLFCETWDEGVTWKNIYDEGPHEATFLKLDCSLIKGKIGWKPCWGIQKAVEKTVEWAKAYRDDKDLWACMEAQAQELIETKAREKYV
ncbi:MAG: CDP-glucose 4,6-dehydratase [Clostridiaceae bacterium]|nr:CDP-glucose 4,6-dehydratase [Clostridiaceae bacterium]